MKIDTEKLRRLQKQHVKFYLIDVREPAEFEAGHIPAAVNIPHGIFLNKLASTVSQKESAIVIYDAKDGVSEGLVERASHSGYINIVSLEGGYEEFLKS